METEGGVSDDGAFQTELGKELKKILDRIKKRAFMAEGDYDSPHLKGMWEDTEALIKWIVDYVQRHPARGDDEYTADYIHGYNKGYEDGAEDSPGLGFEVGFHAGQAEMLEDAQEYSVEVAAAGHPMARACFYIVGPVMRSYTRLNWTADTEPAP